MASPKRERLSVDVSPEEHHRIKAYAALQGKTIREFVLECIEARMRRVAEAAALEAMVSEPGEVLSELWDNEKDADYDAL